MAKNILIWNTFPLLERAGGPSTYLFHLRNFLKNNPSPLNITFLTNNEFYKNKYKTQPQKSIVPQIVRDFVRVNQNLKRSIESYKKPISNPVLEMLDTYDVIHFHSTVELYQAIPLIKNFKGTIALTSHTPMAPYIENIGDALPRWLISTKTINAFKQIDILAFQRANLLIFPAKEAMEPYFNTWKKFKKIISDKPVRYIPTGVPKSEVKVPKEEILKKYNIPADAVVICFAGRHNSVKGYDLFKQFGKEILKTNPNYYFIILGKENPIKGLKNERWKEIGWTDDPFSYINACSIFILPNRDTYFDLILLEVLSLGKKCLISDTGGNNYFKKLEASGVTFFNTGNLDNMIHRFKSIDPNKDLSELLITEFEKEFSLEAFGKRYIQLYQSL